MQTGCVGKRDLEATKQKPSPRAVVYLVGVDPKQAPTSLDPIYTSLQWQHGERQAPRAQEREWNRLPRLASAEMAVATPCSCV